MAQTYVTEQPYEERTFETAKVSNASPTWVIPKPTLVGIDEVTGDSEVDMFKYLKQSDRNH